MDSYLWLAGMMFYSPTVASRCTRTSHHTLYLYGFCSRARDLLVLLVEFAVDVDELGEKTTLRSMDFSYWYFLEKNI